MTVWRTSVKELVRLFYMAITSLVPTMDKARIAWREGEAYDDWDEIVEVIYRNIVGRSLQSAVKDDPDLDSLLPRYNMRLSTYANSNFISITGNVKERLNAFIGLSSREEPFDTADYVLLDSRRDVVGDIFRCSLNEADFVFYYNTSSKRRTLKELEIEL